MEIEKKFLLRRLPTGITKGTKIRQGYLSVGNPEVRVRAKGEEFYLTRKGGEGFVRSEEERNLKENFRDFVVADGKRTNRENAL